MQISKEVKDLAIELVQEQINDTDCYDPDDPNDQENLATKKETVELLKGECEEGFLVGVFMDLSWDLESFTEWALDHVEDRGELKAVLGEATVRHREWDT